MYVADLKQASMQIYSSGRPTSMYSAENLDVSGLTGGWNWTRGEKNLDVTVLAWFRPCYWRAGEEDGDPAHM
jgi:hypothetical protein